METSFEKNKKGILLMILSSLCVCVGQLFWKLGANNHLLYVLIGFCFYGLGAIIMIVAYKYGSLSVLQPMLSLNYVLSLFLAAAILHEHISIQKVVGVVIIIAGVTLIGGGDK